MKKKIAAGIMTGILLAAFFLMIIGYIFLPISTFIILLINDIIFLIILFILSRRNNPTPWMVCSIVMLTVFCFNALFWGSFHMPVTTRTKWQYPIAIRYTYEGRPPFEFFPEELPSSAKNIRYEFLPTILQGEGHVTLRFTADEDYIDDLKEKLKDEAMYITDSEGLAEINSRLENGKTIQFYGIDDGDRFFEEHPDAEIYILYTNYDWNHPRSRAVFIDEDYVFFELQ